MKKLSAKILSVLFIALILTQCFSCAFAYAGRDMQVFITATCADTNHVGDTWYEYYELNGYQLANGDVFTFNYGDRFELYSQLTEEDVIYNDIGYCSQTYRVDRAMYDNGFTIDQYLTVTEDSGIYSGYWCEWYIHFEFVPV